MGSPSGSATCGHATSCNRCAGHHWRHSANDCWRLRGHRVHDSPSVCCARSVHGRGHSLAPCISRPASMGAVRYRLRWQRAWRRLLYARLRRTASPGPWQTIPVVVVGRVSDPRGRPRRRVSAKHGSCSEPPREHERCSRTSPLSRRHGTVPFGHTNAGAYERLLLLLHELHTRHAATPWSTATPRQGAPSSSHIGLFGIRGSGDSGLGFIAQLRDRPIPTVILDRHGTAQHLAVRHGAAGGGEPTARRQGRTPTQHKKEKSTCTMVAVYQQKKT